MTNLGATDISIGDLSKKTGVHIETIRYYERIGVMPKPPRTAAGRRYYSKDFVRRLSFITRSRQLGFSHDDIRALLSLADGNGYSCADVRELTLAHASEARRKIKDLRKLERSLRGMAAECHGENIPECPVVDALLDDSATRS